MRNMSQRTVPIMYTDANTQFGLREDGSNVDSLSLGEHNRGIENSTGVAIRDVCEQFNMHIVTTQQALPPTFYSATMRGRNTKIDHILTPLSLQSGLHIRTHVWTKSGRKLQLIKSPYLADHMPVVMSMTHLTYSAIPPVLPCIDRDAVMRCLLYGKDRHLFLQEVEKQTDSFSNNIDEAFNMKTPTGLYASISQILVHSMRNVFSPQK